jgi:hypothetical protein
MALFTVTVTSKNKKLFEQTLLLNTEQVVSWDSLSIPDKAGNSVTGTRFFYIYNEDKNRKPVEFWTAMTYTNFLGTLKKALKDAGIYEQFVRIPVSEFREHGYTTTFASSTPSTPYILANQHHVYINLNKISYGYDLTAADVTTYVNGTSYLYVSAGPFVIRRYLALTGIAALTSAESKSLSL